MILWSILLGCWESKRESGNLYHGFSLRKGTKDPSLLYISTFCWVIHIFRYLSLVISATEDLTSMLTDVITYIEAVMVSFLTKSVGYKWWLGHYFVSSIGKLGKSKERIALLLQSFQFSFISLSLYTQFHFQFLSLSFLFFFSFFRILFISFSFFPFHSLSISQLFLLFSLPSFFIYLIQGISFF